MLVQRSWCKVGRLRSGADIDEVAGQTYASGPALRTLGKLTLIGG